MSDVSRVEEVYLAAVKQSDPDQQAKYLEAECDGDEDLRRRVETLLAAHPRAQRFLEPPAADKTQDYNQEVSESERQPVGTVRRATASQQDGSALNT